MQRTRILDALNAATAANTILIKGWVRTRRDSKGFSFLEINDGSCLANIQAVIDEGTPGYEQIKDASTGAAVSVTGALIESPGKGQKWEIKATELAILGTADEDFPLQKKRHSDEHLRTIAHLRPRTNKYGAMLRIRSETALAVHDYFRGKGFFYMHTPILTGSDCEGAGEMFRVTTLPQGHTPAAPAPGEEPNPYADDFFGAEANLTVSGQLEAEIAALALDRVYTFGPTFRAENSNTPRHAAEFWMIEPEVAFADLNDNMDLAEDFVQTVVANVLERCEADLSLFGQWVDKTLFPTLDNVTKTTFERIPYAEAIDILTKADKKWEYPVAFGEDLQTEHERFLTEEHCKKPVIVYDYPKDIKAFYMRLNDDEQTVAAMDLLVPRIGELVGGSQREERLDVLERRIADLNLDPKHLWWYLELRRYGSAPHSGFGLGFERLLMLLTGITNIRDVIPFPRTPKHLEF